MKTLLTLTFVALLGAAGAWAQDGAAAPDPSKGRGRGGAPHAWNDKDKDGICDVSGKAVGQGPMRGGMRAGRMGGAASNMQGQGRGRGRCMAAQRQAPAPQAQ